TVVAVIINIKITSTSIPRQRRNIRPAGIKTTTDAAMMPIPHFPASEAAWRCCVAAGRLSSAAAATRPDSC
ncbi:hypothetical protein LINPERPRIM_LOCUS22713, partial [Linum perenne]